MESQGSRGGRRPGAGRPPSGTAKVAVATRLSQDIFARLQHRADEYHVPVSVMVARILTSELTKPGPARRARARATRAPEI